MIFPARSEFQLRLMVSQDLKETQPTMARRMRDNCRVTRPEFLPWDWRPRSDQFRSPWDVLLMSPPARRLIRRLVRLCSAGLHSVSKAALGNYSQALRRTRRTLGRVTAQNSLQKCVVASDPCVRCLLASRMRVTLSRAASQHWVHSTPSQRKHRLKGNFRL